MADNKSNMINYSEGVTELSKKEVDRMNRTGKAIVIKEKLTGDEPGRCMTNEEYMRLTGRTVTEPEESCFFETKKILMTFYPDGLTFLKNNETNDSTFIDYRCVDMHKPGKAFVDLLNRMILTNEGFSSFYAQYSEEIPDAELAMEVFTDYQYVLKDMDMCHLTIDDLAEAKKAAEAMI